MIRNMKKAILFCVMMMTMVMMSAQDEYYIKNYGKTDELKVRGDTYLEGDVKVDDRDELDVAYASGDLTGEQYDAALAEGEAILRTYGSNICELDAWCAAVRQLAEDRIAAGEQITMCREVREWRRKQGMSGGTV